MTDKFLKEGNFKMTKKKYLERHKEKQAIEYHLFKYVQMG